MQMRERKSHNYTFSAGTENYTETPTHTILISRFFNVGGI